MTIQTHQLLEGLDFEPFVHPMGSRLAYRTTLGPYEVEAAIFTNKWLQEGFMLSGTVRTDRTICAIEGELPLEVPSQEQGLALLSYFLGRSIPEQFKPPWLRIGERMTCHLPWRRTSTVETSDSVTR